jgi:hypothetical protein
LHRGPCSFHKLNSNKQILHGTIYLSHGFTLRPLEKLLFAHELPHLPFMEQSRGAGLRPIPVAVGGVGGDGWQHRRWLRPARALGCLLRRPGWPAAAWPGGRRPDSGNAMATATTGSGTVGKETRARWCEVGKELGWLVGQGGQRRKWQHELGARRGALLGSAMAAMVSAATMARASRAQQGVRRRRWHRKSSVERGSAELGPPRPWRSEGELGTSGHGGGWLSSGKESARRREERSLGVRYRGVGVQGMHPGRWACGSCGQQWWGALCWMNDTTAYHRTGGGRWSGRRGMRI